MADNIENNLDYLKEKFPNVLGIRFAARPNGTTMYLDLVTHTREEFFKDITANSLSSLVHQRWPEAFAIAGEVIVQTFNHGKWVMNSPDIETADMIIRQFDISMEDMLIVKDANGQLIARYVSNRNGEIKRLEE